MRVDAAQVGPARPRPKANLQRMTVPTGMTLLAIIIPGLLALDLANGLLGEGRGIPGLPVTPGELGRSVVLLAAGLTIVRLRGFYFRPLQWWVVVLVILGLLGPTVALLTTLNVSALVFDIERLSKVLYGPLLIVLVLSIYLRFRVTLDETLAVITAWGALAAVGVILFKLAGIGETTYGTVSSAYRGLFIAQNDLGLGMVIALAASTHRALEEPRARRFLPVLLTIAGMFVLGTRAATLGAIVVPAALLLTHGGGRAHRGVRWRRVLAGAGLLLVLALAGSFLSQRLAREAYQARKYEKLLSGELTRVLLLAGAIEHTAERAPTQNIIGEGAYRYQVGVAAAQGRPEERSLAEVDWMDLYGAHGFLFVVAVYGFYVWLLVRIRYVRRIRGGGTMWTLAFMGGIYLLHSALAGHALASPLPTAAVAPIFAYAWLVDREQRAGRRRRELIRDT